MAEGKEIDYIKKHKERSPSDVVRDAGGIAAYPHIRDPEIHSLQKINENIYTNPFPLAQPPHPPSSPPPQYLGLAMMLFHPSASISQRHQRTILVLSTFNYSISEVNDSEIHTYTQMHTYTKTLVDCSMQLSCSLMMAE